MAKWLAAICVGAIATTIATVARAEAPEPWRVEVVAPVECNRELIDEVRARAPRSRFTSDAPRKIRVEIVSTSVPDGRLKGRLVIDALAPPVDREVEGASCDEIVVGLALVTALAIEPSTTDTQPSTVADSPPHADRGTQDDAPSASPVRFGVGPTTEVSSLISGGVLGFGAFGSIARRTDSVFAPSARLRVLGTLRASAESASGSASFQWMLAGVDGCPVRIGPAVVGLRPCAGVDVGVLSAEGRGTALARTEADSRAWVAARAFLRAEAAMASWLSVDLDGGVLVPFTRDAFVFHPDERIYRTDSAAFGALSVHVYFP